ncbi:hypothetical protein HOY82DRAFT_536732 [Tuber indicum]|nr:hypothetical protein HOY82DRAFT_536732 [Tuber indicum]
MEEEAHRLYRELMGKEKAARTSDRQKLTEATVVTSETILQLREQCEKVDAAKVAKKANKISWITKTRQAAQRQPQSPATTTSSTTPGSPVIDTFSPDAVDELWEEMEALEVTGDQIGEGSGVVVEGAIRLRGRRSLR